jgi:hypothetical protein
MTVGGQRLLRHFIFGRPAENEAAPERGATEEIAKQAAVGAPRL